ncbi:uncharacterized protein LOC135487994 [Lineus longissimus]|uniref:uncharacterized protein LOC135487994 n=1 Tax=Lineus longissimus TaxID=88925 RepID=UPI002B4F7C6C
MMEPDGYFLLAVTFLLGIIFESSATNCYQCVYYSNMDEDEPLRYQEQQLLAFTSGHYDRDLFYKKQNTRSCFLGPTRAEGSKVLLSECPHKCQTYYREENTGKYVVIRSCAKQSNCFNEMFVDHEAARNSRCCAEDKCNNDGVTRATRCHRCSYNENMKINETLLLHHQKLGVKSMSGLSTTDIERLGFQGSIPNQGFCKYNPWDTEQVLCPSKTCSKLEFWRTDSAKRGRAIHTIVRDCLQGGSSCQTDVEGGSIKCCMENVCNGTGHLYFSWSILIGILTGCIMLR